MPPLPPVTQALLLINTGIYCSYRPEQPIVWEISGLNGVTV